MKKSGKYPCPRCGIGRLVRNGRTPGGKQRWSCATHKGKRHSGNDTRVVCYQTTNPTSPLPLTNSPGKSSVFTEYRRELDAKKTVFIFTAAQNATPVHAATWRTLRVIAKHRNAELFVQPISYRNPTSTWSKRDDDQQWYAPEVVPFLWNVRVDINPNLEFMADIPVIPTAVEPCNGLQGFGSKSKIIGHTKLHMTTVATPGHKMAAILTSTGACTKRNYTRSRAGKLGEFHHSLSAVIVEVEGGKFWLRHLNFNNAGECVDLGTKYTPNGAQRTLVKPSAVILGDTHVRVADETVDLATFGPRGIVETLKPRRIVWHDLFDGQTVNPHEERDPFVQQALSRNGSDDIESEVKQAIAWVVKRTPPFAKSFIVASNHDDFLRRFIVTRDWKFLDPKNRQFYLRMAAMMDAGARLENGMTHYPSPFPHCVNSLKLRNVRALRLGESLLIDGIQCGYHGHKGPNGSRGSIRNMRRIGEKTVIGHGHGPGINEGAMQVGHSAKPDQPYAAGSPSSWMHTHCLIYPNGGKRQLVTIIDGRWRR